MSQKKGTHRTESVHLDYGVACRPKAGFPYTFFLSAVVHVRHTLYVFCTAVLDTRLLCLAENLSHSYVSFLWCLVDIEIITSQGIEEGAASLFHFLGMEGREEEDGDEKS